MTPEEAYEEALRRIREAEKTGTIELDLNRLDWIDFRLSWHASPRSNRLTMAHWVQAAPKPFAAAKFPALHWTLRTVHFDLCGYHRRRIKVQAAA
jgi:hypothetical protein